MDFDIMSVQKRQKQILESMDMEAAWALMAEHAHDEQSSHRPSDEVLLASMHKARIELVFIEKKYRLASVEWLRAHGYVRRGGMPLPPPGVLPE